MPYLHFSCPLVVLVTQVSLANETPGLKCSNLAKQNTLVMPAAAKTSLAREHRPSCNFVFFDQSENSRDQNRVSLGGVTWITIMTVQDTCMHILLTCYQLFPTCNNPQT